MLLRSRTGVTSVRKMSGGRRSQNRPRSGSLVTQADLGVVGSESTPIDPEMQVSHETIYQSLFVQSRGALRKELHVPAQRSGHATG